MVSFSLFDLLIIIGFFISVVVAGFLGGKKSGSGADDYLLGGRKIGLFLFILTNVATWYGGILGVGEFTYRYGLVSWFTQGLPYYIFALLFALLFAGKIRKASLFTIPDKLTEVYGKGTGLLSAVLVFILVSPAPYLLMSANLLALFFDIGILAALVISLVVSVSYLIYGGFRANVYADALQFFVMFAGFILLSAALFINYDTGEIIARLPEEHLTLTGGASAAYLIVWFLIALWTFADPGFHQRCYSAKDEKTAVKGIIISISLWMVFDFLTTSSGLFARALLPDIDTPVLSFPLVADLVLPSGLKGIFYVALFATIMSTLNSFLFLSGTTIGRDFIFRLYKNPKESSMKGYTITGLIVGSIFSIILAYNIPSVIEMWYSIGSLCIPGIIMPVISAYYEKLRISKNWILTEMIAAVIISGAWLIFRDQISGTGMIKELEPMLAGLIAALFIHFTGLFFKLFLMNKRQYN